MSYGSEKLKKLYPDRIERLKHIFEKQVYGLAPTEIIYRIATAFILGFDDTILIPVRSMQIREILSVSIRITN